MRKETPSVKFLVEIEMEAGNEGQYAVGEPIGRIVDGPPEFSHLSNLTLVRTVDIRPKYDPTNQVA